MCCNFENTCPSIPQGGHMSKPQILRSFQKHPPSPSSLCSAWRARYATSPQSDAEGRPEDNASGGRVLQAQMAEHLNTESPHVFTLSLRVQLQIAADFFVGILSKKSRRYKICIPEHVGLVDVVEHYSSLYSCTQVITKAY